MNKNEVLNQLDSLIDNSKSFITGDKEEIWERYIRALKIAKRAVNREYRYRVFANLLMAISVLVVFSSLVIIADIVYR